MNETSAGWRVPAGLARAMGVLLLALASLGAMAQQDPPGRVARLALVDGAVYQWDDESGRWDGAERNRPLTGGDRIATGTGARAELRVGSTVLRIGPTTELELLRLDDERMAFQLHAGSVALRVRSREIAAEIEIVTAEASLQPLRAGHYRIDRIDDVTQAASWRGELRIDGPGGFDISPGQRVELTRELRRGEPAVLRRQFLSPLDDAFAAWVRIEDGRDERTASTQSVSPEMTGVEDLDRYGRWVQHPDYGAVWVPGDVDDDWAPYRRGHWAVVQPWGWTWVDDAPWGFAPFHYGRWAYWRSGWCWVPGAYVARPVFAPALVAWIGRGGWGVSLQLGGPNVGWVPLAPREPYRPSYRASPRYVERLNVAPPGRWSQRPEYHGDGPAVYGNQAAPRGVTVVPREVLVQRRPVWRAVIDEPRARPQPGPTRGEPAPWVQATPPAWPGERREPRGPARPDGRGDGRADARPAPVTAPVAPVVPVVRPDARPEPRADERPVDRRDDRSGLGPRDERRADRPDRGARDGRPAEHEGPSRPPLPAPAMAPRPQPAPVEAPAPPAPPPRGAHRGPRAPEPQAAPAPQPQAPPDAAPPTPPARAESPRRGEDRPERGDIKRRPEASPAMRPRESQQ